MINQKTSFDLVVHKHMVFFSSFSFYKDP